MANDHSNKAFDQNQPSRQFVLDVPQERNFDDLPDDHVFDSKPKRVIKLPKTKDYLYLTVPTPFRGPTGHWHLRGLFFEQAQITPDAHMPVKDALGNRPIFTLRTYDYELTPDSQFYREGGNNLLRSFHDLYVTYSDPGEYIFATEILGSFEHWKRLCDSTFFQPHLEAMRLDLSSKLESEALREARKVAQAGLGPQSLQAAKWLYDSIKGPSKGRGRPTKDEVNAEAKQLAKDQKELNEDLIRLGIRTTDIGES